MTNWIETKDRLPEIGETVLLYVSTNNVNHKFVTFGELHKNQKFFMVNVDIGTYGDFDYTPINKITHWAELPEAPETA
jgi:hypothetical protein